MGILWRTLRRILFWQKCTDSLSCTFMSLWQQSRRSLHLTVWTIADILNALMAIPNLIAVLILTPVIVKETKKYINNLDAHSDEQVPVMDRKNVK